MIQQQTQQQEQQNFSVINEMGTIAERSKLKKLRKKLLCRLAELGDNDNVDVDEVNKIITSIKNIDNILNNMDKGNNEVVIISDSYKDLEKCKGFNTKEEFCILKGLCMGNEEFEDWQMLRKAFRVGVIRLLFAIPEKK